VAADILGGTSDDPSTATRTADPRRSAVRMLTQKTSQAQAPTKAPAAAATAAPDLESLICYFEGDFVPMRDAKVSIMTHAFMYGTATFEGIRAYWNEEQGKLYGLKLREHVERLRQSCRILMMKDVPSVDELTRLIVETIRRNGFREDVYVRPSFYKSTKAIGVRLHHLENELYIITIPFGNYIDTEKGVRVMSSSWRRNADEALPARGKIVGGYVNMAFQKSEAELNGFDEAIVLTADGHVNEASAANLFMVRDGVAITPPVTDDILEGVTRKAIVELLRNEKVPVEIRSIDRSELYIADEMFLCGTGVQISPVVEIDHRPIGSGEVGPIGRLVRERYFDAVRGRLPEYSHWLTEIAPA
jgi:branched-chain amino acid aminotransferase